MQSNPGLDLISVYETAPLSLYYLQYLSYNLNQLPKLQVRCQIVVGIVVVVMMSYRTVVMISIYDPSLEINFNQCKSMFTFNLTYSCHLIIFQMPTEMCFSFSRCLGRLEGNTVTSQNTLHLQLSNLLLTNKESLREPLLTKLFKPNYFANSKLFNKNDKYGISAHFSTNVAI